MSNYSEFAQHIIHREAERQALVSYYDEMWRAMKRNGITGRNLEDVEDIDRAIQVMEDYAVRRYFDLMPYAEKVEV